MSRLFAACYDWYMRDMEIASGSAFRRELLAEARGDVLELGAGTGRNLDHYGSLTQLVMTEPDRHMREKLVEVSATRPVAPVQRVVDAPAEELPFEAASFDVVVSTLVLCTVKAPARAVSEVARVLRPGGRLLFWEHVISERPGRRLLQRVVEPGWIWFAEGCHLCRDTRATIADAGLSIETMKRESMRKASPILRESIRGVARKATGSAR